ncbi:MobA/MobL family protein [Mariprofundus ferrooxydans]|uniref:MobA/MobL protein n=1 Tax=Mariprofundus ferrooxydans PV-1 TaxID=314345 RepID=Q0F1Q5_9PROT|nr:MobA/MobL family protein [Mariprofundus ferrooxydans]EAU55136.1 MobA/MobL protein [Mariprofundus ferrooxydans PV-1]KON47581.1 MobA/MobL protein [Mariprofundus ferrooxydans]
MATYHLTLKIGEKGNAARHFTYICAIEKYAHKRGVVHIEHGNMPKWAADKPVLFWQASDEFERANGTVYRELEVSLPRELPLAQQIDLAKQLAEEACGNNHAFSFAIHNTKASDGAMNPHVHLQFSERIDDGHERDQKHYFKRVNNKRPESGGCRKDRSWQAKTRGRGIQPAKSSDKLLEIRQLWEVLCNQTLADFDVPARIDCRSYADQGIDLIPQPKVGAESWNLHRRTKKQADESKEDIKPDIIKNERYQRWEKVIQKNQYLLSDMAKVQRDTLLHHYEKLIGDKQIIRKELNQLNSAKPMIQTLQQAIQAYLSNTKSGSVYHLAMNHASIEHAKAKKRYDAYILIKNAPIKLSNIRAKLSCWWNHGFRSTETQYMKQADRALRETQHQYNKLLDTAYAHPKLIDKAASMLEFEQTKSQQRKDELHTMKNRLSQISDNLRSTHQSLKLLQQKHPNIDMPKSTLALSSTGSVS